MQRLLAFAVLAVFSCATIAHAKDAAANPRVRMVTTLGPIEVELYADKAPVTVKNFLDYVDAEFYTGTVFHRVIPNFMIQGGGFTVFRQRPAIDIDEKRTRAPILNEADNGLKNLAGTIAMARTPNPHSATAQFFINTVDNSFLDHRDKTDAGWGYCVFGKVTKGMDVVKKIEAVETKTIGQLANMPVKDVVIQKIERVTNK